MVAETEEMLDAVYNESAMLQARVYCWYNKLKRGRKSVALMGRPDATVACTEQTFNTGTSDGKY